MKLQFIEAGEIVTTHGIKGEVKVMCWLDDPEMLCEFDRCRIAGKEYEIVSCRIQKSCNLVKLSGVDTMEAAQAMHGKTLHIYRGDADPDIIFAAQHEQLIHPSPVSLAIFHIEFVNIGRIPRGCKKTDKSKSIPRRTFNRLDHCVFCSGRCPVNLLIMPPRSHKTLMQIGDIDSDGTIRIPV